jgi:hypothetical protein
MQLKDELHEDYQARMFPKLVNRSLPVFVVGGFSDIDSHARDLFASCSPPCSQQEDFASVNSLLVKFRAMEREQDKAQMAKEMRAFHWPRWARSSACGLRRGAHHHQGQAQPEIFRYLLLPGPGRHPHPCSRCWRPWRSPRTASSSATRWRPWARTCRPFAQRLGSEKSQLVRDMI